MSSPDQRAKASRHQLGQKPLNDHVALEPYSFAVREITHVGDTTLILTNDPAGLKPHVLLEVDGGILSITPGKGSTVRVAARREKPDSNRFVTYKSAVPLETKINLGNLEPHTRILRLKITGTRSTDQHDILDAQLLVVPNQGAKNVHVYMRPYELLKWAKCVGEEVTLSAKPVRGQPNICVTAEYAKTLDGVMPA